MLIGRDQLRKEFKELIKAGALGHALVFFGQARSGKCTFALSLANFLETQEFDSPAPGAPPLGDCLLMEPEGGSLGIDQVRTIKEFLWQTPNRSSKRSVIIDQGEKMTDEAQNALLKIAEEPSASSLLMVIVDDPQKLRLTLLSRFKQTYFGPVSEKEIKEWLQVSNKVSAEKAARLAQQSRGAPGLAYALLKNPGLEKLLGAAKKYLTMPASNRSAWVKELVGDEDFDFSAFLEAVLLVAAWGGEKRPGFWHAALNLRREASYFNLNPRLQLLALAKTL